MVEEIDIKPAMVSFAPSAVNTLAQPIIVATQTLTADEITMDGAMEADNCKPVVEAIVPPSRPVSGQLNFVASLEARLSGLTTDGSVPMKGVQLSQAVDRWNQTSRGWI